MDLRKMALCLLFLIFFPSCSSFPLLDEDKVTKEMQNDLRKKYHREFSVTGVRKECLDDAYSYCYRVVGVATDKQNPLIKFQVVHFMDDKSTRDEYLQEFWDHQAQDEWTEVLKRVFQLGNKDKVEIWVGETRYLPENLTPDQFPHYREELGDHVQIVTFEINKGDKTSKNDQEERRREGEGFVQLKESLLNKGIKKSQLKYFYVNISSFRRHYNLTMDHVIGDSRKMEERIRHIEPPGETHDDYVTDTTVYPWR